MRLPRIFGRRWRLLSRLLTTLALSWLVYAYFWNVTDGDCPFPFDGCNENGEQPSPLPVSKRPVTKPPGPFVHTNLQAGTMSLGLRDWKVELNVPAEKPTATCEKPEHLREILVNDRYEYVPESDQAALAGYPTDKFKQSSILAMPKHVTDRTVGKESVKPRHLLTTVAATQLVGHVAPVDPQDTDPRPFAHAQPATLEHIRAVFCTAYHRRTAMFLPRDACGKGIPATPPLDMPWGWHWYDSMDAVSVPCGLVYNSFGGMYGINVYDEAGGNVMSSMNVHPIPHTENAAGKRIPLQEFDELGVGGGQWYTTLPGHWPNEYLVRILFLDHILPPHVPLLSAGGTTGDPWTLWLKSVGILHPQRHVEYYHDYILYRARRLYLFTSIGRDDTGLQVVYAAQLLQAEYFRAWARSEYWNRFNKTLIPHTIVLLRRRGIRTLLDSDDLEAALQKTYPNVPVISFNPSGGLERLQEQFFNISMARILISPHGANINNIWPMQPGTSLIEINMLNHPPARDEPADDYVGLARNMGLDYHFSRAINCTEKDLLLTSNKEEVMTIVAGIMATEYVFDYATSDE